MRKLVKETTSGEVFIINDTHTSIALNNTDWRADDLSIKDFSLFDWHLDAEIEGQPGEYRVLATQAAWDKPLEVM